MKLTHNEFAGGVKAAVEKNRAEKGFKRICQGRGTLAAAVKFFPAAEDEMFAQAKLASVVGECAAIDEFSSRFRQRTFAEGGEILVKLASEN
jgi:hypothetical protein